MAIVNVATAWHDNWYTDAVVEGLRRALAVEGHGVTVDVVPYGGSTRALVTELLDDRLGSPDCYGAVVVGFRLREGESRRLLDHGKPVVVTGGASPFLPSVRIDDVVAARMATGHLLAQGHRSIAHVAGLTAMTHDFPVWSDRIRGYTEVMRSAGFEALARVRPSDSRFEAGHRVGLELLSDESRPTAVFASTDEMAFGIRAAARELGLSVPGDLSLISIDDHPDSARQGLTTIRQVPSDTGVAAAERLLGRTDADLQVMDVALVDRGSTAPPGSGGRGRGLLTRLFRRA